MTAIKQLLTTDCPHYGRLIGLSIALMQGARNTGWHKTINLAPQLGDFLNKA
jgi:hypothetical protein